ncbi:MAG: hypothetical protein PHU47_01830 [Candidatus ainarchaeum sp.]|nr:hypothetical protein [Candidatus ainarchaeum sp.]
MKKTTFLLIIVLIIIIIFFIFANYKTIKQSETEISKDILEYQNGLIKASNLSTVIILGIIVVIFFIFWKLFFR